MKLKQQSNGAETLKGMGRFFSVLLPMVLFAGCATRNTIQSREQEHPAAYAALSPEIKDLVNQGQIKVGMTTNAVYMAWGPPAQVLQSGNQAGESTTWVYIGNFLEQTRYWAGRRYPYLYYDYQPRAYVRAEIIFVNGVVQAWHTLPQPVY